MLKETKEKAFQKFKKEPLSKIRVWGYFEAEYDIENYEDCRDYINKLNKVEGLHILTTSTEV